VCIRTSCAGRGPVRGRRRTLGRLIRRGHFGSAAQVTQHQAWLSRGRGYARHAPDHPLLHGPVDASPSDAELASDLSRGHASGQECLDFAGVDHRGLGAAWRSANTLPSELAVLRASVKDSEAAQRSVRRELVACASSLFRVGLGGLGEMLGDALTALDDFFGLVPTLLEGSLKILRIDLVHVCHRVGF
jgi:hypothetical protein